MSGNTVATSANVSNYDNDLVKYSHNIKATTWWPSKRLWHRHEGVTRELSRQVDKTRFLALRNKHDIDDVHLKVTRGISVIRDKTWVDRPVMYLGRIIIHELLWNKSAKCMIQRTLRHERIGNQPCLMFSWLQHKWIPRDWILQSCISLSLALI